jgi:hypothetical protein
MWTVLIALEAPKTEGAAMICNFHIAPRFMNLHEMSVCSMTLSERQEAKQLCMSTATVEIYALLSSSSFRRRELFLCGVVVLTDYIHAQEELGNFQLCFFAIRVTNANEIQIVSAILYFSTPLSCMHVSNSACGIEWGKKIEIENFLSILHCC